MKYYQMIYVNVNNNFFYEILIYNNKVISIIF